MSGVLPYYGDKASAEGGVVFPSEEMPVFELLDRDGTRGEVGPVVFSVPGAAPYQVQIPVMVSQASLAIAVSSSPRVLVRGDAPASGQVGYDALTGVLTFHADDEGLSASWTGVPLVTPVLAGLLMRLMGEVRATQTMVLDHEARIVDLEPP